MARSTSLEWHIAWRHLGVGEVRPRWTNIVLGIAGFLLLVGLGLALYAGVGLAVPPGADAAEDLQQMFFGSSTTQLQQQYGLLAAVTLVFGLMLLLFGILGRFFNLLASIITFSVMLGCMALVIVLSLMSGFEGDLRDKILNQKAHIRVAARDGNRFSNYGELVERLAAVEGVAGASPYLDGEVLVRSGINRQGATLIGVSADRLRTVSNLPDIMSEGVFESLSDPSLIPAPSDVAQDRPDRPWRLRHLEPKNDLLPASPTLGVTPQSTDNRPELPQAVPDVQDEDKAVLPRDTPPEPAHDEASPVELGARIGGGHQPFASPTDEGWEDPATALGIEVTLPPAPQFEEAMAKIAQRRHVEDDWEDPEVELGLEAQVPPDEGLIAQEVAGEKPAEIVEPDDSTDELGQPILLGRELAMEIAVQVGAPVQLITPIGRMTPAGRMPGVLATRVGGVFYSGMYEYDRKNVYISLAVAQAFLRTGDRVSAIEIKLEDIDELDAGRAGVEAVLEQMGRSDELMAETWLDLNRNLFAAMFLEKLAMFIALLFVVLVASFGILASNLMSVLEKAKEIAILKAMGSNDRLIRDVFVREGLCMGLLGAVCGIAVGLGLCVALAHYGFPVNENVYYFERLPVAVNPLEVAIVGAAALVIVWGSSLYPARVASRMRPVDGLRQGE